MSLTLSCKLAEVFAMICARFELQKIPLYFSTISRIFSRPIESPRYGGRLLCKYHNSTLTFQLNKPHIVNSIQSALLHQLRSASDAHGIMTDRTRMTDRISANAYLLFI